MDREHDLHHVLPVRFDELPVDCFGKERADVLINGMLIRPVENHIVPGPHPWHELDAEQMCDPEDRLRLSLGIGVEGVGLDLGAVLEEAVQDIDRFPDPAGDKVAKERDIAVRNMVVSDATVTAVTDMS